MRLGTDETSIEIVKKALVWYYRLWSFYWGQRPSCCVIHPAESFLELPDEVICFRHGETTVQDAARLRAAFSQPLCFIAGTIPAGEKGFQLAHGPQNPSSSLERFIAQIEAEYAELRNEVNNARMHEKDRQEWRFSEAGTYATYLDGKTKRICLTPERGSSYTFTIMKSTTDGLYFTDSKKGPLGRITEKGSYRKHRHESGNLTADNLDFFPDKGDPALWRFVHAGRGFKGFARKVPSALTDSLPSTP